MGKIISGIQQVGIGVKSLPEAWKWYRQNFGMDVRIFEDTAIADLMLPYTGGQPRKRHAVLALNMQSGGGFEVWQYKERTPEAPKFDAQLGDYGIYIVKIKSKDVPLTHAYFRKKGLNVLSDVVEDPSGAQHFYLKDPYGNIFEIVEDGEWFVQRENLTGGAFGCVIGVSDIKRSMELYSGILGFDEVVYDKEDAFDDLASLNGGKGRFRRVLLRNSEKREGSFSKLLGSSQIELVKSLDHEPEKIYKDRFWGDLGFIHVCFDISGMDELKEECEEKGFPFTVDSRNSFDMGEAAGHFSYISDPDGTLIEFVETHRVPVIKKIGWYLNLKKRDPRKSLPDWMIKSLSFNRVKD